MRMSDGPDFIKTVSLEYHEAEIASLRAQIEALTPPPVFGDGGPCVILRMQAPSWTRATDEYRLVRSSEYPNTPPGLQRKFVTETRHTSGTSMEETWENIPEIWE